MTSLTLTIALVAEANCLIKRNFSRDPRLALISQQLLFVFRQHLIVLDQV